MHYKKENKPKKMLMALFMKQQIRRTWNLDVSQKLRLERSLSQLLEYKREVNEFR